VTVAELIALLSVQPASMQVVVEGYESGFDVIHSVEPKNIERYRRAQEWDGEFMESQKGGSPCLLILGRRGNLR
jgi:hypothetical protein